jgi:hypothetical protein
VAGWPWRDWILFGLKTPELVRRMNSRRMKYPPTKNAMATKNPKLLTNFRKGRSSPIRSSNAKYKFGYIAY